MDSKNSKGVEAGGFLFLTGEDAALAEKERKQIEYLEKKLDYNNPEQILLIYQKLIEERSFRTPAGTIYLKQLQKYLFGRTEIKRERIPFIPVLEPCKPTPPAARTEIKEVKAQVSRQKKEEQKDKLRISMIINFILAAAVIAMFVMTMKSETPNMMNYKIAIENKYAAWEQEISERERIVREKELELKLSEE